MSLEVVILQKLILHQQIVINKTSSLFITSLNSLLILAVAMLAIMNAYIFASRYIILQQIKIIIVFKLNELLFKKY